MEDVHMEDDYMKPAEAFLSWFKECPGTTFHDDIEIVDLRNRGAGRGIVAKRDISEDTVLFTIPRKIIISAETSELLSRVPSLLEVEEVGGQDAASDDASDDASDGRPDAWTSLILILIYEFLRGDQSPWKPYLDMLPAAFETPMFWSAEEVRELQASPVVSRIGRAEADKMIATKVLPVIRRHSDVFFGAAGQAPAVSDEDLQYLAHRMGSTILAYSFSLETGEDDDDEDDDDDDEDDEDDNDDEEAGEEKNGKGGKKSNIGDDSDDEKINLRWAEDKEDEIPLGMVPMADMLNADAEFNAHINHGIDALTATAVRPIKAGEEILNYYGPMPNGELLRRYGYTTRAHEHFDAVDLPWKLVQDALVSRLSLTLEETAKVTQKIDADELEDPVMIDRDFDEDETTGRLLTPSSGQLLSSLPPMLRRQAAGFAKLALKYKSKNQDSKGNKRKKPTAAASATDLSEKALVMAAIEDALRARLGQYATSEENDQQMFKADADNYNTMMTSRQRSAVQVRLGEKRLLKEAVNLAHQAVEDEKKRKDKGDAKAGGRETKKQKTRA